MKKGIIIVAIIFCVVAVALAAIMTNNQSNNEETTRAEFLRLICKSTSISEAASYDLLPDILKSESLDNPISRAEAAYILNNLILSQSGRYMFGGLPIYDKDAADWPEWASDAISLVQRYGLMDIDDNGEFRPNDSISSRDINLILLSLEKAEQNQGRR
jgi:hypothetical protein